MGVVGVSIYLVPTTVARDVHFVGGVALLWALAALLNVVGVACLAELATMAPKAGGTYQYVRMAFGPFWAFLFAWLDVLMIRAGAAAALCVGFASYLAPAVGLGAGGTLVDILLATGTIVALALLNLAGAKAGGTVQLLGTVAKSLALLVPLFVLLFYSKTATHLSESFVLNKSASDPSGTRRSSP